MWQEKCAANFDLHQRQWDSASECSQAPRRAHWFTLVLVLPHFSNNKQRIIQIGSAATTAAPFAAFGNSDTFPVMYSTCPRVRIRRLEWSWEKQLRTSGAFSTYSCSPDHRHPSLRTPPAATPASPGGFRQIGWSPLCQVWNHRIQVDLPKGKVARPSDGICGSMARLCFRAHVVDEFSFSVKLNCSSTPATSDWNS